MDQSYLFHLTETISWTAHNVIVTSTPLFRREATSEDCSQAEQQASRQAFQQASQFIQQARQSALEAAQQASQSASNSMRQAYNSASQLIAAASRSSSSVESSASSAISSIQASASSAVARAIGAMQSAEFTASLLQQEVSKAGATATAANEEAQESQNAAITATQAAVAIVGSIIASTLLTMLVFWCIVRYRKKKYEQQRTNRNEEQHRHHAEERSIPRPGGDEGENPRKGVYEPQRKTSTSTASSLSSHDSYNKEMQEGQASHRYEPTMKEKYLAWNPQKPPKAPTLKSRSQFEVKDGVSPFPADPITLQTSGNSDEKEPQGKQLNSPTSMMPMGSPRIPTPGLPLAFESTTTNRQMTSLSNDQYIDTELKDKTQDRMESMVNTGKDSAWTDDKRSTIAREESSLQPQGFQMVFPKPDRPIRTTAEWFIEQQQRIISLETPTQSQESIRESLLKDVDSPSALEASRISGQPKTPKLGVSVSIKSMKGEVHYVNSVKSVKSNVYGSRSSRGTVRTGDEDEAVKQKPWETREITL
ncbi:hypothetical protein EAF04_007080 [Stromatinia cepivora]|nr:hypothetical protein EAF04_007080 [Stromatinia cepivora]